MDKRFWPIKHTYKKENLEGEVPTSKVFAITVTDGIHEYIVRLVERSSS